MLKTTLRNFLSNIYSKIVFYNSTFGNFFLYDRFNNLTSEKVMIKTIKYADLGINSFYWLDTKHHFSFVMVIMIQNRFFGI